MSASGLVAVWHDDEGWGVIESAATPGGCWTHFSAVRVDGFASLTQGQEVSFEFEPVDQDGYRFRAAAAWPAGHDPATVSTDDVGPTTALGSTLTLTFDEAGPADLR